MAVNGGLVVVLSAKDDSKAALDALDTHLSKIRSNAGSTSGVLGSLTSIGASLGITLGLQSAIAAFGRATTSALAFGETLEKAAAKTGLSVSTLSTLHYAADVTNSDFDSVTTAVARMGKTIGAAADGNRQAAATLKGIGLDAKDLAGRSDGAEIALRKLGVTLAATGSSARRNELATALTGRGGVDQVALLQRLGTNFDEFRQKAEAAGVQLGGETAAELARANEQLRDMQERVRGASLGFTSGLIPAISGLAGIITGSKGDFDSMAAFGDKLGRGVALASAGVLELIGNLRSLQAKSMEFNAKVAESFGAKDKAAGLRQTAAAMQADADDYHRKADAAMMVHDTGFAPGAGERISDHRRVAGTGGSDAGAYAGTPKVENADALREAQRTLDDANRKAAEEAYRSEADEQKSHAALMLTLLEEDYKQRRIPEADYYARRLQLEKAPPYADQAADIKSLGALAIEKQSVQANPGATEADRVKTQAKLVELSTEQQKLADRIYDRAQKIGETEAKAAGAAAERTEELRKQSDELAVQLEEMRGGTAARLKQENGDYKIRREQLVGSYGENSPEVGNYDALHAHNVQAIGLHGAEEQSSLASAQAEADRRRLEYQQQAGQVSGAEAREQNAAIGNREADALEPVLAAYRELAAGGDMQATAKVAELSEKIYELRKPIDEVSAHMRESFDGAFEGLFLNFDQGAEKAFESFSKELERTLQKALYDRTIAPQVERLVGGLTQSLGFPATRTPGGVGQASTPLASGGSSDGSLGDVVPFAEAIGGLGGVASLGDALPPVFRPFSGGAKSLGGAFGGIFGGGGASKPATGRITIELQNSTGLPMELGQTQKQGGGLDQWEVHAADSYSSGGFLRQLFHGMGG